MAFISHCLLHHQERLICKTLNLALTRWDGFYKNAETTWLRWETLDGILLPTPEEYEQQRAEQEKQRADAEQQRADAEQQRAERLAEKLRSLGINPEDL